MIRRDRFFAVLLALVLGSGLWGLAWSWPSPLRENHAPAPWPALPRTWAQATAWSHAFDRAWGDRFPWRWAWVALNGDWRYQLLRQGLIPKPPVEDGVAIGRGGMLFYSSDAVFRAVTGRHRLSDAEKAAWLAFARAKAALAKRHHAVVMLVLAPDKATVYPDLRPSSWDRVGPGLLEQVSELLSTVPGLALVDLRDAMQGARADGVPAYERYDSHWTYQGAAYGWQALLRAAQQRWPSRALPPLRDPSDWGWTANEAPRHGDLADQLGLWPLPADPGLRWPRATLDEFQHPMLDSRYRWDASRGPRDAWLFYNDSFALYWGLFMRRQDWSCRFALNSDRVPGAALDDALMDWARPSVLVIEIAERALPLGPPA